MHDHPPGAHRSHCSTISEDNFTVGNPHSSSYKLTETPHKLHILDYTEIWLKIRRLLKNGNFN